MPSKSKAQHDLMYRKYKQGEITKKQWEHWKVIKPGGKKKNK